MDDFKKYITQRVEELDIDMPREKVWESIKQNLQPAARNAILVYIKWAVAACVIALAGFGLYKLQYISFKPQVTSAKQPKQTTEVLAIELPTAIAKGDLQKDKNIVQNSKSQFSNKHQTTNPTSQIQSNKQPITNSQLSTSVSSLNQIENTFTQIINLQKAKVNTTPLNAESPGYFNDFTIEMKHMERDEQTIKKDISKTGLTDELLDQLIKVYQQKLNMLKQLQIEINKTNNRFKQNRSPEESTKTYFLDI